MTAFPQKPRTFASYDSGSQSENPTQTSLSPGIKKKGIIMSTTKKSCQDLKP